MVARRELAIEELRRIRPAANMVDKRTEERKLKELTRIRTPFVSFSVCIIMIVECLILKLAHGKMYANKTVLYIVG